jgi:hypothetical protein
MKNNYSGKDDVKETLNRENFEASIIALYYYIRYHRTATHQKIFVNNIRITNVRNGRKRSEKKKETFE